MPPWFFRVSSVLTGSSIPCGAYGPERRADSLGLALTDFLCVCCFLPVLPLLAVYVSPCMPEEKPKRSCSPQPKRSSGPRSRLCNGCGLSATSYCWACGGGYCVNHVGRSDHPFLGQGWPRRCSDCGDDPDGSTPAGNKKREGRSRSPKKSPEVILVLDE